MNKPTKNHKKQSASTYGTTTQRRNAYAYLAVARSIGLGFIILLRGAGFLKKK